jgi:hypothetical protein
VSNDAVPDRSLREFHQSVCRDAAAGRDVSEALDDFWTFG